MNNCKFNHEGTCYNCGSPQFKRDCETSCACRPPMTNYDRIKSMNIEEMAVNLLGGKTFCPHFTVAKMGSCRDDCKGCIKQWLESEVEE